MKKTISTTLMKKAIFSIILTVVSVAALALEDFIGKVTLVQPTYLPERVSFKMDAGNVNCPAGNWLWWEKSLLNNKFVYATLMLALATGKQVRLYMNDGDTTCTGQYLHLMQ